MKVIITKDYDELSKEAFKVMKEVLDQKEDTTLGLATGSTPIGLYKEMIKEYEDGKRSYKKVKTFNLDEYVGLDYSNEQSYVYFMRDNLFDHIDIDLKNTNIENGKAIDKEKEIKRYNDLLENNTIDLQVLGIGSNGHIAFNEPGTPFSSTVQVINLKESTIKDNARFFKSIDDVPRQAFTMGLKNIMKAKKILILASGKNKAKAVYGLFKGDITVDLPASILQLHPDCVLICDDDAAELIK